MAAVLCENLGASKFRRMFTNEIMGDLATTAAMKDLLIQAQNNIIIKPNSGKGADAAKFFKVLGDASVTGVLRTNGLGAIADSLAIENITFQDSALTSSDNVMSLHGQVSVQVEDVVFTDNQMRPSTDADLVVSAGATKSVLVEGVKVTDNTVSTSSGALAVTSASGTVTVENVSFADGAVSTTAGGLTLASAAGTVQVEDVVFADAALSVASGNLSLAAGTGSSVVVESVTVTDSAVSTSSGDLTLSSATGVVKVDDVRFSGSALSVASGDITVTAGDASAVRVENVTVADNTVSTSSGSLSLTSTAGTVQVEDVLFTDTALSTVSDVDLTLTAGATKSVVVENVKVTDNTVSTSSGSLSLTSTAGTVQVEDVLFTDTALSTVTDSDLTLTAGATKSVVVENVKVTDNTVSTSTGSLILTSAAGTVRAEDVVFTDSALSTSNDALSLDAAVSVDLKKDVVLTSTAGGSGKITTAAGQLELTSASGVVKISGNLEVAGSVNSVTTTQTNIDVVDKTISLAYVAGGNGTNANADGGGIFMGGNPALPNRAITWHMGAGETSQDKGDNTGSYWHIEGGQLLFSRTIPLADRYAPGTSVLLSSLASGADDTRWEFTSGATSEVGSKVFALNGGASVSDGLLKINDSGSQSASCADAMPAGTFTIIAKVTPKADLSFPSANGLVLLSYAGAGGVTTVSVANSGHLAVSDGANSAESASSVLTSEPFTVALVRDGAATAVYFNGVSVAAIATSVDVGASPALTLGPGKSQPGYSVWYDDVRVNASVIATKNGQLYGWKEMYAHEQVVTYGFRIGNDESMQLVKIRGSGSHSRALNNAAPNTVTNSNDMGAIGSTKLNVCFEAMN